MQGKNLKFQESLWRKTRWNDLLKVKWVIEYISKGKCIVLMMIIDLKKIIKIILRKCLFFFRSISNIDEVDAYNTLNAYSPDPATTCIGNNELKPEYDLQIVIPAYNAEAYIADCLESVLQQETSFSYLVTVVNDGSTDRTLEIIEEYYKKNENCMEIISQENKGFSGARNAGMKILKGRYIAFLDSDDILIDGAIDILLRTAKNDKNFFDMDIVQGAWYTDTEFSKNYCLKGHEENVHTASKLSGFPWGKIYKAELLEKFQFPEGYWFEDTPISFILYGKKIRFRVIEDIVYGYRVNPKGISATAPLNKRSVESYYITELCLREFPVFGVNYDERAYRYFLNQCVMNGRRALKREKYIREAIFVLEANTKKKYFSNMRILDEEILDKKEKRNLQDIEKLLEERQFSRFELFVRTR